MLKYIIFFVFIFSSALSFAGFNWRERNPIANTDLYGFVHIDKNLPNDFGDENIKFTICFSSDIRKEASILGSYWNFSLLNSFCVLLSDTQLKWVAPNGVSFYFNKDGNTSKNIYLYNGGEWIAQNISAKGDAWRIEKSGELNTFYEYKNGRLIKFCTTANDDIFLLKYQGKKLSSIYNLSKRKELISISYNDLALAKSFTINGNVYEFEYAPSPSVNIAHTSLLSKITYPDKSFEAFEYTNSKASKARTITNKDFTTRKVNLSSINRLVQTSQSGNESWVEWDANTGIILADSGGEYEIGNNKDDSAFSNGVTKSPNPTPEFISLTYKSKSKKHPERYFYSWGRAIKIISDPDTGESTRYHLIGSNGPSYLNVRKIEKTVDADLKKPNWKIIESFAYDNKGRIIRKFSPKGIITWKYTDEYGSFRRYAGHDILQQIMLFDSDRRKKSNTIYSDGKETEYVYTYFEDEYTVFKIVDGRYSDFWTYDMKDNLIDSFDMQLAKLYKEIWKDSDPTQLIKINKNKQL